MPGLIWGHKALPAREGQHTSCAVGHRVRGDGGGAASSLPAQPTGTPCVAPGSRRLSECPFAPARAAPGRLGRPLGPRRGDPPSPPSSAAPHCTAHSLCTGRCERSQPERGGRRRGGGKQVEYISTVFKMSGATLQGPRKPSGHEPSKDTNSMSYSRLTEPIASSAAWMSAALSAV